MKKITVFAIALLICAAVSSCGGEGEENENVAEPENITERSESLPEGEEESSEDGEIAAEEKSPEGTGSRPPAERIKPMRETEPKAARLRKFTQRTS